MGVNLYIVLPSAFIALFSSFPWCCWFHAALDQLMEIHSTIPFYFFFFCGRRWRYLLFLHKDLLLSSNFVVAAGQLKRCSCLWYPHSAAVFLYIALSLQRSHGSYGQMARSYGSFSQYTFSVWIFFSSGFLFVFFFLQLHNTPVFYTNIYLSSQFRALQWRLFLTHECQIKIFKRKFFFHFLQAFMLWNIHNFRWRHKQTPWQEKKCKNGRSGSAPYRFLTTKSLTEGFLPLHTQSMNLCLLQQVFNWDFVFCRPNTHELWKFRECFPSFFYLVLKLRGFLASPCFCSCQLQKFNMRS